MNFRVILRYVALALSLVGVGAVFPLVVALLTGETKQAIGFGLGVFTSAVVLGIILLMVPPPKERTSNRDVLVILVSWWFLAPVVALPGFLVGIDGAGLFDAFFEAVSCLTTTGTSRFAGSFITGESPSVSLIAWRGALHFIGAMAALASALTILPALNFGGTGMQRTRLFAGTERSMLVALRRALGVAALVMVILLVFSIFCLALTGMGFVRSLTLSLSAVTTGLVDPVGDLVAARDPMANLVITAVLFMSSISVVTVIGIRTWPRRLWKDSEALALIVVIPVVSFVVAYLAALTPGSRTLVWAASHVATSGIMTEPISTGLGDQVFQLVMLMTLIGGAALSTAGGVKVGRILILSERSRLEFTRLGYQNSVEPFIFRGRLKDDNVIVGVWVYLVAYVLASVFLGLVLSVGGRPFDTALIGGLGLLSNAGHLVPADLGPTETLLAGFGMILGRVEVLALMPMLRPGFWKD